MNSIVVDSRRSRTGASCRATSPDGRAGEAVRRRSRIPDVKVDVRVIRLVHSRDLNGRTRRSRPRTRHLDLGAGEVELGLAEEASVQANMLHADKILSGRRVLGDLERRGILAPCAPILVLDPLGGVGAEPFLVDLEPVAGAVVRPDVAGSLGHVDLQRTRVLHLGAVRKLKAELRAGGHLVYLGIGGGLHRALVAAEVIAEDLGGEGRHVVVGVPADVLKVLGRFTVDNELGENVVPRDQRGDARQREKNRRSKLHFWERATI